MFDSLRRPFDGVTASLKYNVWHSLERRALASLGVEATPPLGRQETWEIEPFVSFGANPGALVLQGEVVASWEEAAGVTAFSYRLGVGREVGRVVPMLDAGWTVPRAGEHALSLYPQLWIERQRVLACPRHRPSGVKHRHDPTDFASHAQPVRECGDPCGLLPRGHDFALEHERPGVGSEGHEGLDLPRLLAAERGRRFHAQARQRPALQAMPHIVLEGCRHTVERPTE